MSAPGRASAPLLALVLACDPGAPAKPASAPAVAPVTAPVEAPIERVGFASELERDEELRLFPAVGLPDGAGWRVQLRAWVYEPEEDSWRRGAAIEALAGALELPPGSEASAVFRARARAFLVDNERGKRVVVRIGRKEHVLGATGPNGQSETTLRLASADLAGPVTEVRAVLPEGDARGYVGAIYRMDAGGVSVVSDVDDTIKISEVRDRPKLLERTFLRAFEAVPGIADAYARWAGDGATFHYVSASPWQLHDALEAFRVAAGLPAGSLHLKSFRAKDASFLSLFVDPEAYKRPILQALIGGAPGRRFVLVGDSGERDPEAYAAAYVAFPTQVAAIYIRDVTGEGRDAPRYATTFAAVPAERWTIFRDAAELPARLP